MHRILFLIVGFFLVFESYGQLNKSDSLKTRNLLLVTIESKASTSDIQRLDSIEGTYIFSGKKTEVIELSQKNVTLAEKYGRQIFSKIPGLFVYDMDGTGNQLNISTRGLDAHRGWEINNRKDGIITNSDMYGYPASHYNIPMEAVERIEFVRGTSSLQYGAQFGGMINYISKQPDSTKKIAIESVNTIGSYGLVSTFNGITGKIGKFSYSAWINGKWITGYRNNSDAAFNSEAISLFYEPSKKLKIKVEWTHSNYLTHVPGPLTDSMFRADPQMSTRSRNYYSPNIHIPSLSIDWKIAKATRLRLTTSAVLGSRSSVLFDKLATIKDTIATATLQYNNRQVDIDNFNSYTTELRLLQSYSLFNQKSSIAVGFQYMNNNLHRRQQGKGTTGTDFDLSLVNPVWGRNLNYKTSNFAFFAENRFLLTKKWSVNAGFRMEIGETNMSGEISYYADSAVPNKIKHNFPLLGFNSQFNLTQDINLYAGWSQAYRPVIFKDIIPQSVYEVSDKNLKDAFGYNAEIGFRGKWKFLKWDFSGFLLQYNNRLGTLAQTDSLGNLIIFRTNIGNARTAGLEMFVQSDFNLSPRTSVSVFTSSSFMDGRYQEATVRSGGANVSIKGNKVESVPTWISRSGLTFKYSIFQLSLLYSFTSESFADALNTLTPNASGALGLVPSYQIVDVNFAFRLSEKIKLQFNINNLFNESYFTKRPLFYPGPGIWPSDGRTVSGTFAVKI